MTKLKQQSTDKLRVVHRSINSRACRSIETSNNSTPPKWLEVKKIALPIKGGIALYHSDELFYCKAQGNYTRIYFSNSDSILLSKTIKDVEKQLPGNVFFRCHQSYIINTNHVRQYTIDGGLVLDKIAESIPVSRRKRKNIMANLTGRS